MYACANTADLRLLVCPLYTLDTVALLGISPVHSRYSRATCVPQPADADDQAEMDDTKFDKFMGNDAGIFQSTVYDKDDEEADAIWQAIDGHMD